MRLLFRLSSIVKTSMRTTLGNGRQIKRFRCSECPPEPPPEPPKSEGFKLGKVLIGTTAAILLGFGAYSLMHGKNDKKGQKNGKPKVKLGEIRKDLPFYTQEDLDQHKTREDRVWMTYKNGVYDVTDYIDAHPGGEQLTMAGGRSLEPFWKVYTLHLKDEVYEVLEALRIGNIKVDCNVRYEDPYENEPERDERMDTILAKPFNGSSPLSLLIEEWITPNGLFYVRNHLPVPKIDPDTWKLTIEVEGDEQTFTFTLDDLKKMPKHSVNATLMCNGNRRDEMGVIRPAKPPIWRAGAMSNATWSGVKLADLLNKCGVTEEDTVCYNHVQFEQYEPVGDTGINFGGSIFFNRAIDPRNEVLVAYEMNGEPLPPDHGFPARIIAPGIAGARSIKWLGKIKVAEEESPCYWQKRVYKGFGPSEDWGNADFERSLAIQELPVQSAICRPNTGDTVSLDKDGFLTVQGYAYSGGGQKIIRVDVTADGGNTWHVATIDRQDEERVQPHHWTWSLWTARIPVPKNASKVEIWAKAVDSSHNTQPESWKNIFNFRGVICNAYHRVPITIK